MARICVLTAGHLSTCPRMVKAADALAGAGHRVRVVSARYIDWAVAADADAVRNRSGLWDWTAVNLEGGWCRTRAAVRRRAANLLAALAGPGRSPVPLAARAYGRAHDELVDAVLREPMDLVYGGGGALAAAAAVGERAGVPYAIDLEDFHSAEQDDSRAARVAHALVRRIERAVLPRAAFLTAGSSAIASAYRDAYGVAPLTVNNVFPLPSRPPALSERVGAGLRLYWFSQTVGPRRGLEDAIRAMGMAEIPGELHVRGRASSAYLESLVHLAEDVAPALKIVPHDPAPPDAMVQLCAGYDIGLSLEQGHVRNRELCLTNKAFTYMLGGLALAFTDTAGQRPLAEDLGEGAVVYTPGDVESLARGLLCWAQDGDALRRARTAAWQAAVRRWHWEHPLERGALLDAVERVAAR
ncbi:MAG TPA: hypothetical protein VMI34_03600 [Candidatus Bathyarchaeia archaeon]|nr:hypothetical protein [Candidatus Bathyarchaeia archaeon]